MKFAEINKKFTEKVAEWMAKGYHINTATMSGHQGEVGKIDLTDGHEIVRILLDTFRDHERRGERGEKYYEYEGVKLVVGRSTDSRVEIDSPDTFGCTLWNNKLEIISSEEFYEISTYSRRREKWYGTKEESIKQQTIMHERWNSQRETSSRDITENNKVKAIAVKAVRKQKGMKSVTLREIEQVIRKVSDRGISYEVVVRGKRIRIGKAA